MKTSFIAALVLFAVPAPAQIVDYPDSAIGEAASFFPISTPRDGRTVRGQILCPSTAADLPQTKAVVWRVGFQLAGREPYATFVLRAGTTKVQSLTGSWSTNLPDQRIQKDLSGTVLPGGTQGWPPQNVWVEFDLDHPFIFTPGDAIVVDITARSEVPGEHCKTAMGPGVWRAYDPSYDESSTGPTTISDFGGLKLRFAFMPLGWTPYGTGCGPEPQVELWGVTEPKLGGNLKLAVNDLTLTTVEALLCVGGSRTWFNGVPLPIAMDGFGMPGCQLLQDFAGGIHRMARMGSSASLTFAVPNDPGLLGLKAWFQGLVCDVSTNPRGLVLTQGLEMLLGS